MKNFQFNRKMIDFIGLVHIVKVKLTYHQSYSLTLTISGSKRGVNGGVFIGKLQQLAFRKPSFTM